MMTKPEATALAIATAYVEASKDVENGRHHCERSVWVAFRPGLGLAFPLGLLSGGRSAAIGARATVVVIS